MYFDIFSDLSFSVLESKSKPIWLVVNSNNEYSYEVGVYGSEITIPNLSEELIVGRYYYTDTMGFLIPGSFLGQELNDFGYINNTNKNGIQVVVTKDSLVGFAASSSSLIIQTEK